jgi:hypothetical protein
MKNQNKKLPNQVNPIVFSNPINETVKNKTVVREL